LLVNGNKISETWILKFVTSNQQPFSMQVNRVFDILTYYKEHYGYKDDVLAGKDSGEWVKYNIDQYIEFANYFSSGLLSMGLKKGSRVITISNNRPEWNFIDMGLSQIGMVHVPVYPTISKDDYTFIFKHCMPEMIIVSDFATYEKIKPIAEATAIPKVYSINKIDNLPNWTEIIEEGKVEIGKYVHTIEDIKLSIQPSDLFTIIYTSGTTGFPKGVMLSHRNLVRNVLETSYVHENGPEAKCLSFLPLSHIYERMLNYHYQFKGIGIYYAENMSTIGQNLREIKPQIFCAVPRILELFFEKIQGKGHDLPWLKRKIFFWALHLGMQFDFEKAEQFWYKLPLKIANFLVYHKIRESLGGALNVVVSGGASLQPRLARIFWAANVQVLEGYGLSETSPVIAVNRLLPKKQVSIGTVGTVIKGLEVKIAEDGEILCRGHSIMMGYYNQPELTKSVIDEEGWFHTGDIGTFEKDIYLKITDRKKEIFKLSSGKYIAPQIIENKLKESEFIEQAMVIGENEKFASALIQPNFFYLHNWCTHHKIYYRDNDNMINKRQILDLYQKVINNINKELGQTEQIKRIRLVPNEWSVQSGELSPTLKLKRKFVMLKYKEIIRQIYSGQKN
jgi:long-chain acyl-CoA synthetase